MRLILAICIVSAFCVATFGDVGFVQQVSVNGNAFGSIDDVLPNQPTVGDIYIAVISHPPTTTVDGVSGDDGSTHLRKISWVNVSGVIVETWKAYNVNACCKNFHIDLVGEDTVAVNFAEWGH